MVEPIHAGQSTNVSNRSFHRPWLPHSRVLASGLEDGLTQKSALARTATRSLTGSIAALAEE
jgi:hypothetical protein